MAGNRGVTLFVLLLSCWHEAKLQPINMTSGPTTEMPPSSKSQEDMPGVFDPILNENFQVGVPQNYHGLPDNSQFSLGSEDKIFNNGKCNPLIPYLRGEPSGEDGGTRQGQMGTAPSWRMCGWTGRQPHP
ncbi:hypothetical protein GH733_006476, partial [Mirounga leonina]